MAFTIKEDRKWLDFTPPASSLIENWSFSADPGCIPSWCFCHDRQGREPLTTSASSSAGDDSDVCPRGGCKDHSGDGREGPWSAGLLVDCNVPVMAQHPFSLLGCVPTCGEIVELCPKNPLSPRMLTEQTSGPAETTQHFRGFVGLTLSQRYSNTF